MFVSLKILHRLQYIKLVYEAENSTEKLKICKLTGAEKVW